LRRYAKGVIVTNTASTDRGRSVPGKYLNNSELQRGWPGGDPDAAGAEGWIMVDHPLDGRP